MVNMANLRSDSDLEEDTAAVGGLVGQDVCSLPIAVLAESFDEVLEVVDLPARNLLFGLVQDDVAYLLFAALDLVSPVWRVIQMRDRCRRQRYRLTRGD